MLLRASFRHRWRSWLSLSLLIALVSGLTLAASAAGRRSDSAFTRYEAAHGYDAFLFAIKPIPKIATLPVVATSTLVGLPTSGTPTCACSRPINFDDFGVFEVPPKQLSHMVKLESGRIPDQSDPDQVLASFTLEQDDGVHVGTVIRVPFAAPSQRSAVLNNDNPDLRPAGPTVSLRVVGIEASEIEFPFGNSPSYDLYTTSAFARTLNPQTVVLYADFVQLRHGAAGFSQFQTQAKALGGLSVTDIDNEAAGIEHSIRPQSVGWWILAGLSALVGIVVVVQALARQATAESEAYATLSALGVSRRQLVLVSLVRTLFVAVVGTAGGVILAFLVSPLTVVGEVRLADTSTGFVFDAPVLLLGGLAAIVAVLVLGIWPAIRTARATRSGETAPTTRPSRIVSLLVGIGAPPSALIGVRHALERGRGSNAIPVGSALLGAVLAVTALCATAVFGASLTHLTSTPTLYGQPYDEWFSVNQTGYSAQNLQMLAGLERNRGIADITAGLVGNPTIDGVAESGIAAESLRGPMLATATSGRLPQGPDEVAFGATTLHQLGVHVGSLVRVRVAAAADKKPGVFRVVGTVVFSPGLTTGGLGNGAVFTLPGLLALAGRCPAGPHQQACVVKAVISAGGAFLVRAVPGAQGHAALTRLNREYPSDVNFPAAPTNLVNFGQAVNFPLIFGAILVLFGAATSTSWSSV
jgi:ABC-type lipoprotein release transport system permease subunit